MIFRKGFLIVPSSAPIVPYPYLIFPFYLSPTLLFDFSPVSLHVESPAFIPVTYNDFASTSILPPVMKESSLFPGIFITYDGPGYHCQHLNQKVSSSFQILIMTNQGIDSRNSSLQFSSMLAPSMLSYGYTEVNASKPTIYHIQTLVTSQVFQSQVRIDWIE